MKKEEDVETSGGGRKGQKKKEIALPGFHIESLRSSGTFTPSPSPRHRLPPSHPPIQPSRRPRRLLTLNFLSCITALRLSSRVKKKKEKYKWKKPARRRERPCPRGKEVLRQICRSPPVGLFPLVTLCARRFFLVFLFFPFFLQRTRKHDRRAIDPKTLYGETRQRNAEYRRKFTFVMACNKYLFDRTLFQLFI